MAVVRLPVTPIDGTVTTPRGFRAAGIHCGIKPDAPDLALVAAGEPVPTAGMFTTNKMRSAPVIHNEAKLRGGRAQAVLVNSGNANACTGPQGDADARTMAEAAAGVLGASADHVLVASTGVIGRPLPMDAIQDGLPRLAASLGPDGMAAARAIMTTDAFPKTAAARVDLPDGSITIGGIAKGCGMIHPNMATMIAIVTTDAAADASVLRSALRVAVNQTFNCISVDGDTSTSDSAFLLASGRAGPSPIPAGGERYQAFTAGLTDVCRRLARLMVRDGEGAEHVAEIAVRGARSDADARLAGNAVMTSLLFKTALHGAELNWGRIAAAVGRSGADVDPRRLAIAIGEVTVVRDGVGLPDAYVAATRQLAAPEVRVTIDLGLGSGRFTGWTSDLGEAYVKINSGYLT